MTTLKLFDNISRKTDVLPKLGYGLFWLALFVASLGAGKNAYAQGFCDTRQTITANVVVLDNPTVFNRLGAQNPNWITYALRRDVVQRADSATLAANPGMADTQGLPEAAGGVLLPGQVELRPDKRPRPLVVRSVAGACLTVNFTNLLAPVANPNNVQQGPQKDNPGALFNDDQVAGRCAGFHASGTELVTDMADDGSMVGKNDGATDALSTTACGTKDQSGLVAPGDSTIYELYTPHEGAFVVNSYGATIGSEQSGGNLGIGMFGALNVQPPGARLYRSQVTEEEMRLATVSTLDSGHPVINYETPYPNEEPWISEGKAGLPILNMLTASGELVHSDINAIIAGPNADGSFPPSTYPLESAGKNNPVYPNRLEPFREFTSIFHDEQTNSQVFPEWYKDPVLGYTLDGVGDAFMINYGSGGIGSEIIANRLHTGPMHDCTDCAYEEFFLASQTVGDPAQLVNFPANTGIEACSPRNIISPDCWRQFNDDPANPVNGGQPIGANPPIKGNYALFQEDPSNVHHSYVGDQTKIRNTHAGAFEQHIFHLHNQQWLFNPNDDNANYLDAQEIMPGSGHTYELVNGGSGNRNKTVGDAIFHCHFYPHFAQGMWYHIRIKDVFERGTVLAVSGDVSGVGPDGEDGTADDYGPQNPSLDSGFHTTKWALRSGKPAAGARALPDGELPDGAPIPAIVPLPGKAMPPMPAKVTVAAVDRGDFGVLSGRRPPNGLGQGPDSSQAVILDWAEVAGTDGEFGTKDDVTPGYPFWLAGNTCGEGGAFTTDAGPDGIPGTADDRNIATDCPEGTVGQRMPTPVLDMLTEDGADALKDNGLFANVTRAQAGGWDGGLPRHNLRGYTSGGLSLDTQNRLDFRKIIKAAQPVYFPETGTALEKVSMAYQSERSHDSFANKLDDNDTSFAKFITNGSKPVPGGPYQDPCVDDRGKYLGDGVTGNWYDGVGGTDILGKSPHNGDNPRTYRIANVQIDAVFNKVGHHYSQERIIALWGDVEALINKQRPPEPLVMRFNSFDCGRILHSNLVPAEFELDDFQVRTPTDIIGQHIHLPKWDLTTNDGAANGWNYEDGTLSPLMVQERIHAINAYNALAAAGGEISLLTILTSPNWLGLDPSQFQPDLVAAIQGHVLNLEGLAPVPTIPNPCGDDPNKACGAIGGQTELHAVEHPFFGKGQYVNGHFEYKGARTTIQRILVDPVVNVDGVDRGLGLTFSHDHYGPSTFQQIGLYSTILAEPVGSTWVHNESGQDLWGREVATTDCTVNCTDGGPTTWQAAILTGTATGYVDNVGGKDVEAHREFYFEMSDFQHAYNAGVYVAAGPDGRPLNAEFGGVKNPDACAQDPANCELEKGPNGGKLIPQIHKVVHPTYADTVKDVAAPTIDDFWQETINPTLKLEAQVFPDVVTAKGACPGTVEGGVDPNGTRTNFDPDVPRPCAEAINIGHSSTWVINYRNEPVGLRVFDPNKVGPDGASKGGAQADGPAGDLALAFQSRDDRAIPQMNTRFGDTPYPTGAAAWYCDGNDGDLISCDRGTGDPFTPIMRAYEGDEVKVKIQVGATEEQHQTTVHGIKWLSNGSGFGRSPNSGHRNFQSHGISEQFSLQAPFNPALRQAGQTVDYLYATDATRPGIWLGTWGLLRTYGKQRNDLVKLPNNDVSKAIDFTNDRDFTGVCPKTAPVRDFDITAVLANEVLPNKLGVLIPSNAGNDSDGDNIGDNVGGTLDPLGGTLVYNRRGTIVPDVTDANGNVLNAGGTGPLNDPTAMMYVMTDDLMSVAEANAGSECFNKNGKNAGKFNPTLKGCNVDITGCTTSGGSYDPKLATCPVKLRDDAPVEPLVLRANAGDCIDVTLRNRLVNEQATTVDGKKVYYSDGTPVFGPMADGSKPAMYAEGGGAVTEADVVYDLPPDLAGWQDMMWGVTRRVQNPDAGTAAEMYFFNNNLVRPGMWAGIHPQLVAYDASRDDGVAVGRNQPQLAAPGGTSTSRFYAGDLEYRSAAGRGNRRNVTIVATPVEFGASNLLSADRIKQPQKGLFGALSIEPVGATYPVALADEDNPANVLEDVYDGQGTGAMTRKTRAQVNVSSPAGGADSGGDYREALAIGHKIANLRWADGRAIKNIHQGELGREGAEDSGHAGFNYGMEPSWFRFKLAPDVPFGNAGAPNSFGSVPNPQAMYANVLVNGEPNSYPNDDPATPVFTTTAGNPTRMYVLNGASADRDGTFILHGHLWQRDPYVCPDDSYYGLPGYCDPYKRDEYGYVYDNDNKRVPSVGSLALGTNPIGKYMGGEEGMGHVYGHWPILFNAGGTAGVKGDYLYRDYTPSGNRNGQFGILRVE